MWTEGELRAWLRTYMADSYLYPDHRFMCNYRRWQHARGLARKP